MAEVLVDDVFWPFKAYFTVETCYLSVNVLSKLSLIILH